MRLPLASIVWIGFASAAHADPAPPPPLADAIKAAAAAHRPLIVELGATWCGPCREFEAHVLPDARAQAALKDAMFVRYDTDAEPGSAAGKQLAVDSFPTFIGLDKTGAERFRRSGMPPGEAGVTYFLAIVGEARLAVADEADILAPLKANPNDAHAALDAAHWYATHDKAAQAIAQYDAVTASPGADRAAKAEAAHAVPRLRRAEQWKQQLIAEKVDLVRRDPASASLDDLTIAALASPPAAARPLVAAALAAQTDPDTVNSMVYIALAAGATDEALAAATRIIAKARDPEHLDTLAECHHMRGARAKALEVEAQAIAMAKGTQLADLLTRNQARFTAGGAKDSDDVIALRARVADLWKRLALVDVLVDRAPANAPSAAAASGPNVKAFLDARKGTNDLALAIVKACGSARGKATLADIRVDLDATGKITASTVLLEQIAPDALRSCIGKQLAAAKLPVPPAELHRQLVQVDFESPR